MNSDAKTVPILDEDFFLAPNPRNSTRPIADSVYALAVFVGV